FFPQHPKLVRDSAQVNDAVIIRLDRTAMDERLVHKLDPRRAFGSRDRLHKLQITHGPKARVFYGIDDGLRFIKTLAHEAFRGRAAKMGVEEGLLERAMVQF